MLVSALFFLLSPLCCFSSASFSMWSHALRPPVCVAPLRVRTAPRETAFPTRLGPWFSYVTPDGHCGKCFVIGNAGECLGSGKGGTYSARFRRVFESVSDVSIAKQVALINVELSNALLQVINRGVAERAQGSSRTIPCVAPDRGLISPHCRAVPQAGGTMGRVGIAAVADLGPA